MPTTSVGTPPVQAQPGNADTKIPNAASDAIAGATGGVALPDAAKGVTTLQSLLSQIVNLIKQLVQMLGSSIQQSIPPKIDHISVAPAAGGWWRP